MKIKKGNLILVIIFFIAFKARLIISNFLEVGTDEILYSLLPWNIISAQRLGTLIQSHVYAYIADIGYILFGEISQISIRFGAILFGGASVFIIYLMVRHITKSRIAGFVSAFFFSLSGYALLYNIEAADMVSFFFALVSIYLLLLAIKFEKEKYLYLSAVSFGIGFLSKNIIVTLTPILLIGLYFFFKKQGFERKKVVPILTRLAIIFIIVFSPLILYNYFVYTETGYTDFYFSSLGIGENFYSDLENKPWDAGKLVTVSKNIVGDMVRFDLILLLFGIAGAYYGLKRYRKETVLLLLSIFLLVAYIGGVTGSPSHFVWVPLVWSIFAGMGYLFVRRVFRKIPKIYILVGILVLMSINTFHLANEVELMYDDAIIIKMRDFVTNEIPDNALVVTDPRIYGGNNMWIFNDRSYLKGVDIGTFYLELERSTAPRREMPLYYIECSGESMCGWKEEDFMKRKKIGENLSDIVKQGARASKVGEIRGKHEFTVYEGNPLQVPENLILALQKKNTFWKYHIGWGHPELAPDNYDVKGIKWLLHAVGMLIHYIEVIIAFLSPIWVAYVALRREVGKKRNTHHQNQVPTPEHGPVEERKPPR